MTRTWIALVTGVCTGCASTGNPADSESLGEFRTACIDVAPVLGEDFVDCGTYEPVRGTHIDQRKVALKCALRAQRQGRAFIYHYIETSFPDVHLDHIVVIGERGERLLRQWGDFGDEMINFVGTCEKLKVRVDGYPEHQNCGNVDPLIERLKIPSRSEDRPRCDLTRFKN